MNVLNELLNDVNSEQVNERQLRAAFLHAFKTTTWSGDDGSHGETQRTAQKILSAVATNRLWNAHNSIADVMEYAARAKKDSNGLLAEPARLAVVDALRRVPTSQLPHIVAEHKTVLAEQQLLGLPFVVAAQVSKDTPHSASKFNA